MDHDIRSELLATEINATFIRSKNPVVSHLRYNSYTVSHGIEVSTGILSRPDITRFAHVDY